jgi:hypothetical protein
VGISRRKFLKEVSVIGVGIAAKTNLFAQLSPPNQPNQISQLTQPNKPNKPNKPINSMIFRSLNGTPKDNLIKVVELMGGIEKIVGQDDVVIIKPNGQWWNQGAPNLLALNALINLIMNRPGFSGEVIIAENCHRGPSPWRTAGWETRFERNSDLNGISTLNQLCQHIKGIYGDRFSVCHLIDVSAGNKRVFSPKDGNGYVYCDGTGGVPLIPCDNGLEGKDRRTTIMTDPVFKSDRGTLVDFKKGVWEKGAYTGQPIRFINFAALNHHSTYCGMTSAVKNYMGITDLSGGPDPNKNGRLTKDYYNFHSFPFNEWGHGPEPGMLGKEIGTFMRTIRKADLNITTAEWIGLSSRVDCPVVQTRAILASTDPVALDYHAAKYLLYPNSQISLHNPDNEKGPLRQYLVKCAEAECGMFDERLVKVTSYDYKTKALQKENELVVKGKKEWGNNVKAIMKYFVLRYWIR